MSNTQKLSSCGFQPYSYRDFTKQLRQLLQDRYTWDGDGFTILKELIQNANDAGATILHLGWSPPLFTSPSASNAPGRSPTSLSSQAPHPLLTVPALFAVNNGPLRASDAINITRLGSNSKAGEASSAGRFGLGLKSVFHLCEAFFFLAQPFEEHASLCSIFNPWSPPRGADEVGPYEHWDFDPDGDVAKSVEAAIRSRLEPIFAEASPSFCLWMPLRDERVLKGDALVQRFLSGTDLDRVLVDSTLQQRVAELLPFLHGLQKVTVWSPNAKGSIEQRSAVSVEPSATRPVKLPEPDGEYLPTPRQSTFAGKVIVSSLDNKSETSCEFVGAEAIVTNGSIQALWKNKNWPPDESLDPETNKWREHRVKLIPHGALRFMAIPKASRRGRVSMHWCVFLPLGQSTGAEHLVVEAAIAADVSVFLHGYFFIDAGRTRHMRTEVEANDIRELDAEALQKSWNATIEKEAIWPQFLEALAAFVSQLKWDERQVEELTRALLTMLTRVSGNNTSSVLPIVCRAKQWLYLLKPPTESNRALGNWVLKTANAAIHDMPRPTANIALYDLLPGIAFVGSDRALSLAAWPRISANESTPWPSTLLKKVAGSVVPSVLFKSNEHLEYFALFLEHCANSEDQKRTVAAVLWPMLKKAFQDDSLTLQRIEELGTTLRRVLEYVPEEHRLVLSWASSERRGAESAFRLIANDECDLLPIPSSVRPQAGSDCRAIASRIVVRLLRQIEGNSFDAALMADVVGDLLKRADLDRDTVLQSLKDVRLLVVYDCDRKQVTRKTWVELAEHKRQRLVFCDQAGLTQQLQSALGEAGVVWRIDPGFAEKVLGDKHDLSGCSARECAAVLAPPKHGFAVHLGGAALGAWEARQELLKKLVGTLGTGAIDDQERLKDACRLLIHGRSQDAAFNAALYLAADGHFDPLAEKLVRHVVAKRQEEWRILTGEAAVWAMDEGLTATQRKCLNLYSLVLSEPAVLDLLEKSTNDHLNGLDLSKDEYATLLTDTEESRNELLKRLPIHPVSKSDERIAILSGDQQRIFWDDGYELDAGLTESITLLTLDKRDKRVADRQRQLAPVLDREQALRLALNSPQPQKHWPAIIKAVEKSEERPPEDIARLLWTKPWFPTQFGGKNRDSLICLTVDVSGGDVTLSEHFRQVVTTLVVACEGAFVTDWMLDDKLRKQLTESRKVVCQRLCDWGVFPDENQSLQQLGLLLAENDGNQIGFVPLDLFEDWLEIHWDAEVMPGHLLLKAVYERFGLERCFNPTSAEVRTQITRYDRIITILNFLADHHERAKTRDAKCKTRRVFAKYLEFLLNHPNFETVSMLRDVRLLSRADVWKASEELCLPPPSVDGMIESGIAGESILADDLAALLAGLCASPNRADAQPRSPAVGQRLESEVQQAADIVADYFRSWEGNVPNDVIGGFLALLGGDPQIEELANRYLGKRSLDETRRNLRVSPSPFGHRQLRMPDQRFSITIVHGASVEVTNLLGQRREMALATDFDSVLVGFGKGQSLEIVQGGPHRVSRIQLRHVDFSKPRDPVVLTQLLSNAARLILADAYEVRHESLPEIVAEEFRDLRDSDQLEIRVVQQLILEDAELLLSQLGLQSDELLGAVIAKQTSFRRLRAERVHNEERFDRRASWTESEIDREQGETNSELKSLLGDDQTDGPRRILNAVRQRIQGHNQYNPAAVPFELFQNADDACVERDQLLDCPVVADSIEFHVGADLLAVKHFGRRVNQVPKGADPRKDKRADDLRKMLTLWLSNKDAPSSEESQLELTGKFGLGFKSVFLVSDKPKLLSGQLACEIVGGIFPRHIDIDERACFERYVRGLTPELRREVTVIELPLIRKNVDCVSDALSDLAAIVGRFRELAHLLVVFAQQIRRIEVVDETLGKTRKTEWNDQPVPGVERCFKGTLQPFPDFLASSTDEPGRPRETFSALRAIVLRTSRHGGALLLVHNGKRFQKLPKEVPTLWVTAPTLEGLDVGFALNARFNLDPGRAQLGRESPKNEEIAAALGRDLGQRFVALFEHSRKVGWSRFCEDIGLDNNATESDFWDSLWELLGPGLSSLSETSNASKILLKVFWHPTDGAARFYREHTAIPTRLRGASDRSKLVALRQVRYAIGGVLSTDDGYGLMCVRGWPEFKRRLDTATLVDARSVFAPLRDVCEPLVESIQQIELSDVLEWELPERTASPACANSLGELIHHDLLKTCERREETRLGELLYQVQFKNRDGKSVHARGLLIGHRPSGSPDEPHRDERMRAEFAPRSRVLSSDYGAPGVAFFEVCRAGLEASVTDMAQWVFDAADKITRNAALRYLAEGDQGRAIQREINNRGMAGSWLEKLAESEEFQSLGTAQQGRLLEIIPHQQAVEIIKDAITPQPPELPPPPADVVGRILKDIHKWWSNHIERERNLRDYERRTFPESGLRHLNRSTSLDDDLFRKDWVILFLLGLTHTMGRTVAEQHREFLRRCEHDGTLRMIASSEREPGAWMGWINDFLDRQLEDAKFLQWMKQFVGIYQVSRHLDDYIGVFESIEQNGDEFSLATISNTRSSSNQQGGGFDAPPLSSVLGMGQCFVLRELVRKGVITNKHAHRHCYVPSKRVRDLLMSLGCEGLGQSSRKWELSRHIHEFLTGYLGVEAATFQHCFDIPFQIIAEDEGLQAKYLKRTIIFKDEDSDLWYPDAEVISEGA
jgi:hypothetical protein